MYQEALPNLSLGSRILRSGPVGGKRPPRAAWSSAASWPPGIDTGVNGWPLALRVLHRLKLLSAKSCKLRSCGKQKMCVCACEVLSLGVPRLSRGCPAVVPLVSHCCLGCPADVVPLWSRCCSGCPVVVPLLSGYGALRRRSKVKVK